MRLFIKLLFAAIITINLVFAGYLFLLAEEFKLSADLARMSYTECARFMIEEWLANKTGFLSANLPFVGAAAMLDYCTILFYILVAFMGVRRNWLTWKDVPPLNLPVP